VARCEHGACEREAKVRTTVSYNGVRAFTKRLCIAHYLSYVREVREYNEESYRLSRLRIAEVERELIGGRVR